jgi:hypothetical protein
MGCINTYLRSQVCSIHSLACKTSSHQVASWRYRQVDHQCPYSQLKCPPFCWWSLMKRWRISMCFVLACWTGLLMSFMTLSLSHSNDTFLNLISKSFNMTFIQRICAQQLPATMYSASVVESAHYFASLMIKKEVIFLIVDMCPMCFFSQPCILHNRSLNIQSTQTLLLWDTIVQHFVYASTTSIFSWWPLNDSWWGLKLSTHAYTKHHIRPRCGHIE